jgi:hypothetical protein
MIEEACHPKGRLTEGRPRFILWVREESHEEAEEANQE